MADAILIKGGGGDDLSVVTATSDDVLEGKVIVDKNGDPLTGKIPVVGDQWLAVKSASWGGNLDVVPTRGYYDGSASHAVVPAADVRKAIGYTDTSKVLEDTTIAGQKGAMKNLTDRSTIEFASENNTKVIAGDGAFIANNTDGVKRVCIRYNGENGYIGGNTLFGLPARSLTLTPDVNGWTDAGDANKLIDSVTVNPIPNLRGTYSGQGTSLTTYQSRLYFRLPIGYYYGGSYDSSGGVAEVYMPFASVASALGIDASKIRQGTTICGVAGTLAVQSAISFDAAALSPTSIRISWKNPAKGPWQGIYIRMSTSGYPGSGGDGAYVTAGFNPNQAGGSNYYDVTGLSPGTTYYFTCTSYCDALGFGTSYNVMATTQVAPVADLILPHVSSNLQLQWYSRSAQGGVYETYEAAASLSGNHIANTGDYKTTTYRINAGETTFCIKYYGTELTADEINKLAKFKVRVNSRVQNEASREHEINSVTTRIYSGNLIYILIHTATAYRAMVGGFDVDFYV